MLEIIEKDGVEYVRLDLGYNMLRCGVPHRFTSVRWPDLDDVSRYSEEVYTKLEALRNWTRDDEYRTVVLQGPPGTGKTTYAAATFARVVAATGGDWERPRWVSWPELLREVADSWKVGAEHDVVHPLELCPFLVIDDWGKEVTGTNRDDLQAAAWQKRVGYQVINSRYNRSLHTLLTTELDPGEMGKRIDQAITSRLMHEGIWIDLHGVPDWRMR